MQKSESSRAFREDIAKVGPSSGWILSFYCRPIYMPTTLQALPSYCCSSCSPPAASCAARSACGRG